MIKLIDNQSGFECEGCVYYIDDKCTNETLLLDDDSEMCSVNTIFVEVKNVVA